MDSPVGIDHSYWVHAPLSKPSVVFVFLAVFTRSLGYSHPTSAGRPRLHRGLPRLGDDEAFRERPRLSRTSCVLFFRDPIQLIACCVGLCVQSRHPPRAHGSRAYPPYSHGPHVGRLDLGARRLTRIALLRSSVSGARSFSSFYVGVAVCLSIMPFRLLSSLPRGSKSCGDSVLCRSVCVVPHSLASFIRCGPFHMLSRRVLMTGSPHWLQFRRLSLGHSG